MRGLSQSSINRQQNIPSSVQQAMNQHMKNTLPAHLQHQMGDGLHMSPQTQKAISDHMQRTMPSHLKQYAGAYMEQRVINPSLAGGGGFTPGSTVRPHAPMPDRLRLDHSNVSAAQYDAKFHTNLFASDQATAAEQPAPPGGPPPAPQPAVPTQAQAGQPQPDGSAAGPYGSEYGFIMEPPPPPKRGLSLLPSDPSMPIRIGIVAGGVLILLILFIIMKGLLSGGGNSASFVSIAQDQQEIIHIANLTANSQTNQQAVLSSDNQNFAVTAQTSLTSAQSQILAYLKQHGKKVKPKTLDLKVDAATDQRLTSAAANSTYDSTFKEIMKTQLTDYQAALKQAYKQTPDATGRKIINDNYKASELLLIQLNSPES